MSDTAYQVYLDRVRECLKSNKKRLLTEKEEAIVINHLEGVALAFENDPENSIREARQGGVARVGSCGGQKKLSITQILGIETAKKVSEIHPDFDVPTEEQVNRRVEEVLAVQNYLHKEI